MDKQFICELCGLSYTRQPNLSRHQIKTHGNLAERKRMTREIFEKLSELHIESSGIKNIFPELLYVRRNQDNING